MIDFAALVESHRRALRLHCYRMLGSSHDADDMVQETFARALRAKGSLRDAGAARGWLYRIATNVCLDELARRPARARGPEVGPPSNPETTSPPATGDENWIEPAPSAWLGPADPASLYTARESVALAFVAALQVLTPAQRAVLLLRDVVGLSAEEAAAALDSTVAAVHSALHRARAALEVRVGPRAGWSPESAPVDRDLLERYLRAWTTGDLETIVGLLHDDVTLSMPPVPRWLAGADAVGRFFAIHPAEPARRGRYRTAPVDAAGQPAGAFYRLRDEDGTFHLFGLQLYELRDRQIATIDHFMSASAHAAFVAAGLPLVMPA